VLFPEPEDPTKAVILLFSAVKVIEERAFSILL